MIKFFWMLQFVWYIVSLAIIAALCFALWLTDDPKSQSFAILNERIEVVELLLNDVLGDLQVLRTETNPGALIPSE